MRRSASILLVVLGLVAVGAGACNVGETIRLVDVQTGKSLNADKTVGQHTTSFAPDDTLYVSVLTEGSGSATITARWMYSGTKVNELTRDVTYRDRAATEFYLQRPGGLPVGTYTVEILFDGEPVETRELRVR